MLVIALATATSALGVTALCSLVGRDRLLELRREAARQEQERARREQAWFEFEVPRAIEMTLCLDALAKALEQDLPIELERQARAERIDRLYEQTRARQALNDKGRKLTDAERDRLRAVLEDG
ncbi:MAG TPA: hypothetical protein VMS76_15875 [Planctomycetota bacterium]|nr:hypothetical protein [Planctomycetota bacterium]